MGTLETEHAETTIIANAYVGGRKKRIIIPPEQSGFEVTDPIRDDLVDILSNRKEIGVEGLAILGRYVTPILPDLSLLRIYMSKLGRNHSPIACTNERYESK